MQKTTQNISVTFNILGHILTYFGVSGLNSNLTCYFSLLKNLAIGNKILSVSMYGFHCYLSFTIKVRHDLIVNFS